MRNLLLLVKAWLGLNHFVRLPQHRLNNLFLSFIFGLIFWPNGTIPLIARSAKIKVCRNLPKLKKGFPKLAWNYHPKSSRYLTKISRNRNTRHKKLRNQVPLNYVPKLCTPPLPVMQNSSVKRVPKSHPLALRPQHVSLLAKRRTPNRTRLWPIP